MHFGLGADGQIEQLEILWPSGQLYQYLQVTPNQYLQATEDEGIEPITITAPQNQ